MEDLLYIRDQLTKVLEDIYGGCEITGKSEGQTEIEQYEAKIEFNYMGKTYNLTITEADY